MSVLDSLYGANLHLSTQLINPKYLRYLLINTINLATKPHIENAAKFSGFQEFDQIHFSYLS